MLNLAKRNFLVYIKDKGAVAFSLLGVFVIIGLYMLFLGDVILSEEVKSIEGIDLMMDGWVLAGIVAVASITTSMGAFGIMVTDQVHKQEKDIFSAPIARWKITGGYILGAAFTGIIMSLLAFTVSEIYLLIQGAGLIPLISIVKIIGIIILAVAAACSMVLLIMSFIKTNAAYSGASTILGTLIGFLTGMYMPIGSLSESMQWVVKCFPLTHASALLRRYMTQEILADMKAPAELIQELKEEMGVVLYFGDTFCSEGMHMAILAGTVVLFFLLSMLSLGRKRNYM